MTHHAVPGRCNVSSAQQLLLAGAGRRSFDGIYLGLPYIGEKRQHDDQQGNQYPDPGFVMSSRHVLSSPRASMAAFTRSGVNGTSLSRTPVASNMALAIAAGPGTEADSPAPSSGLPLAGINMTSISGTSGNFRMGYAPHSRSTTPRSSNETDSFKVRLIA